MHEMSLAGGILKVVEDAALREGFVRVSQLHLEAGALSGVEVGSLRFALDCMRAGTCLAGSETVIDEPLATACRLRRALTAQTQRRADSCPRCGGHQIQPTGGTELRVVDMLVHDTAEMNEGER